MDKKALKAIPVPIADISLIYDAAAGDEDVRGVIISQKENIGAEETLILNVYHVRGKDKADISLLRVFCQKGDYITFEAGCKKWRTGSLLNLGCEYWREYCHLKFLTAGDAKRVEDTVRRWDPGIAEHMGDDALILFDQYQQNVKKARLMEKHKKETDVIDSDMEKFGELPDDYQEFIEEKVFKDANYIFYDTKKKRAFCTSCKMTFILKNKHLRHEIIGIWNKRDDVGHNRTVMCPYCNKSLLAKSEGMGRESLVSVEWSLLVQPHDDEVLTRYFCHTKDFRIDFHDPEIKTWEGYRTVHRVDRSMDYMWAKYKMTGNVRWCYYRNQDNWCYNPSVTVIPRRAVRYNTSLQEVVAGTCMRYSVPDIFLENVANDERYFRSPWLVDDYFNSCRKYPFIEQLLKVGFYRMTRDFLEDNHIDHIELNNGQRSILGTLGINKNQYNMLRRLGNPGLRDLEILRYKADLKWDEFEELRLIHDVGYADIYKMYIDVMKYTTLHKLRRYINRQKIMHDRDYFDYIGWLEEMGYDMKNEFNLFPKNFKKAHDEMSRQYIRFKDKKIKEDDKMFKSLLRKFSKETAKMEAVDLHIGGLFIRMPSKLEELKKEGESLHHCVGTYIEKVAKGETSIFFVRKEDVPDKPYFTLEYKDDHVVQCRGAHNCDMPPNVKAFVKVFERKMQYAAQSQYSGRKVG